jgi:hypothetical protein
MHARLERAVQRGAASLTAGLFEGIHLGMRFAGSLVRALAEHDAFVRHDTGAHYGVGCGASKAPACVLERTSHPPIVVYHFS